jgi:hypothetical protein
MGFHSDLFSAARCREKLGPLPLSLQGILLRGPEPIIGPYFHLQRPFCLQVFLQLVTKKTELKMLFNASKEGGDAERLSARRFYTFCSIHQIALENPEI